MSICDVDVCRLCLAEDNLVWVFDDRFEQNDHMKDVIFVTTGVEIHMKDAISQKICTRCVQIAIKMFQFREKSLKNDKYLKSQCRKLLKNDDIDTDVAIKTEKEDMTEELDKKKENLPPSKAPYRVHPSMYALSKKYPKTQFPSICVKYHVAPVVLMEMHAVDNYFRARNLRMQDYVRLALRLDEPPAFIQETAASSSCALADTSNTTSHVALVTIEEESERNNNRVPPINMVKNRYKGYTIIRSSKDENDKENNQKEQEQMKKKRHRLSDDDLTDAEPKKIAPDPDVSDTTECQPVLQCDNCSEVFDNAKDLKSHQNRHSRCHFCKTQFPSVPDRQLHEESTCHHKKAMNNLPDIEVHRVEHDLLIRRTYHKAFSELFPPIPEESATRKASSDMVTTVIEILSDDETTENESSKHAKKSKPNHRSVSVLKPDVRIRDSTVLDQIGKKSSDVHLLKELLRLQQIETSTDKLVQMELPRNDSIKVDESALTVELTGLKHLVGYYKIPVYLTKVGPLKACYNYEPCREKPKKLHFWDDLTPIDVRSKTPKKISTAGQVNCNTKVDRISISEKSGTGIEPSNRENKPFMPKNKVTSETHPLTTRKRPRVQKISSKNATGKNIQSSGRKAPTPPNSSKTPDLMMNSSNNGDVPLSVNTTTLGYNFNNTTISPIDNAASITLTNLLNSSCPVKLPTCTVSANTTTSSYTTITSDRSSVGSSSEGSAKEQNLNNITYLRPLIHSNVLIPRTSPDNQSSIPPQVNSKVIARNTHHNSRASIPSQIGSGVARTSSSNLTSTPPKIRSDVAKNSSSNLSSILSQIRSDVARNSSSIHFSVPRQIHSDVVARNSSGNPSSISYQMHPDVTARNVSGNLSSIPPQIRADAVTRNSSSNLSSIPPQIRSDVMTKKSSNTIIPISPQMFSGMMARNSSSNISSIPPQVHSNVPTSRTSPNNSPADHSSLLSVINRNMVSPEVYITRTTTDNLLPSSSGESVNNPCSTTAHINNNLPSNTSVSRRDAAISASSHNSTMANFTPFNTTSLYSDPNQSLQQQMLNMYYHPYTTMNQHKTNIGLARLKGPDNNTSRYPPPPPYSTADANRYMRNSNYPNANYRGNAPNISIMNPTPATCFSNQQSPDSNHDPSLPFNGIDSALSQNGQMVMNTVVNSIRVKNLYELR